MKYFYSFVLLTIFTASTAFAVDIHDADTLYVDSVAFGAGSTSQIKGKPDNQFATINQSIPLIDVSFKKYKGGVPQTSVVLMKGGSTILVWEKKDLSVDSSAGQVVFFYFNPVTQFLEQSQETFYLFREGLNDIPVPAGTWEYAEFSLPGAGVTPEFAKSYLIDAVALVQDTDAFVGVSPSAPLQASRLRMNYPNPFRGITNVSFSLEQSGAVEVAVVDLAGVEHNRIDLGYQSEGLHSEPLAITDDGVYFLRLYVNGMPTGKTLKIVSQ